MKLIAALFFISLHAWASVGEPQTRWIKKNVSVCWANGHDWKKSSILKLGQPGLSDKDFSSFNKDQKEWIKEIISSQYTLGTTGIHYSGWQNCAQTPNADLFVIRAHTPSMASGMSTIGHNGKPHCIEDETICDYRRSSMRKKAFVTLNTYKDDKVLGDKETMKLLALHEFGHASGLRHENIRIEEASKDPKCVIARIPLIEEEDHSTTRYGDYDNVSVMSYCHLYALIYLGENGTIELSMGDKKALKEIYRDNNL